MKIFNFFSRLKKKEMEPKIYVILLESPHWRKLAYATEYSFEAALVKVKKEFLEEHKKDGFLDTTLHQIRYERLFVSLTLMEAFGDFMESESKEIPKPAEEKNEVMNEIIRKKDLSMIEKYSGLLTEEDKRYLSEKIKNS